MTTSLLALVMHGAGGRMGREIISCSAEDDSIALIGALGRLSPDFDAAWVRDSDLKPVVIDFSIPEASLRAAKWCQQQGCPLVVGTTGFTEAQKQELILAGQQIPLLISANMSLGVNVLLGVLSQVAHSLGRLSDIEIVEWHHRYKRDAPSGTALAMGEAIASALDLDWPESAWLDRQQNQDPDKRRNMIGFSSLRAGDMAGQHSALFALEGESLELGHRATSRRCFAHGALTAARWLSQRSVGCYSMRDVLGLNGQAYG